MNSDIDYASMQKLQWQKAVIINIGYLVRGAQFSLISKLRANKNGEKHAFA